MSLDLWLSLAGLSISAAAAIAILRSSRGPGGRPAFLALVFLEAALFFLGVVAGRLPGGSFLSAACSYCGSFIGLPSLYLFARSTVEKVGRRACLHYLPALANLPLGLAMAALGSSSKGGLAPAIYYLVLVAALTAQLVIYGRAALVLARDHGGGPGPNWLLRAARAVISAYALLCAMSWAMILVALAEELVGRPIESRSWIDPASLLVALFLAWTLGLCALWGRDRNSAESRELRKYGGRPLPEPEADRLVRRVRALVAVEPDLAAEAAQPRALASRLGVPYYLLSRAVNELEGRSLLDLVNEYRVERAKAILSEKHEASVLDACFEAGFQAKSTFNEVFKKRVGMTPRQFRETASRESEAPSRGA